MTLSPSLQQDLPSPTELPCSDDTPVDNELQNLLPNLLLLLLTHLWSERTDWYFGVDMAIYHTTGVNARVPVVPDGFLSLQVERLREGQRRRSYVTWAENNIAPILTLELVSYQPGGEYDEKMETYANLGVLYYVIYNPEFWRRDQHQPFEVYKLVNGHYQLQTGEPYWMPEVGLGIGRYPDVIGGFPQEILTWYDAQGSRHLSATEQQQQRAIQAEQRAEAERQQKEQERQQKERLEEFLRAQGIDPNQLPPYSS
jgi:Uma2 family endonuclease